MKRNAGYLFLLITFFCWGSIYIVSKYALAVMGPVTVGMCRYAVSVLCLYGLLKLKGRSEEDSAGTLEVSADPGRPGIFVSIILQLGGTALLSGSLLPDQLLKPGGYFPYGGSVFKGADHLEECSQHRGLPDRCLHHSWKRQHGDQHDGRSVFHWIRDSVVCRFSIYPQDFRLL